MSQHGRGEWFRGASGWVWMGVAAVGALAVALADLVGGWDPEVTAGALFAVVLVYVVMVRPVVGVVGDDLVVRHMTRTDRLPVAAVRSVYVGRVLEIRAGRRRLVSPSVSRSLRQVVHGSRTRDPQNSYGDFVETRIEALAAESRERLRVSLDSDEQFALAERGSRSWAWPELVALVATGGLFLVLVLL